jgi:Peptidase family M48
LFYLKNSTEQSMKRSLCALILAGLLFVSGVARPSRIYNNDERAFLLPAALVGELENWLARADFWRLVVKAEFILANVEIGDQESEKAEAWVCTPNKICISSGLRQLLTEEELQAAIAHEIGHIVIPRPANGHAQLWEMQCDMLAVALTRNVEQVKDMLFALDRACHNCRDAAHLAPLERVALLDYCAEQPLEKIARLDALRAGNFAILPAALNVLKPRPTPNE